MKHAPRFLALVEAARADVREMTIADVEAALRARRGAVLIDCREDHEFAKSRIPGAIHLGRGVLERDVEARVPELDTELILYCGGGYRSVLAAESLGKMGYTRVASMAGGYREWADLGLPIEA